jgi:hypothetical protein
VSLVTDGGDREKRENRNRNEKNNDKERDGSVVKKLSLTRQQGQISVVEMSPLLSLSLCFRIGIPRGAWLVCF